MEIPAAMEPQPEPRFSSSKVDDDEEDEEEVEEEERIQTVIFVRHGVAQHNYQGADLTSPTLWDPPLVPQGKKMALHVGHRIQQWLHLKFSLSNHHHQHHQKHQQRQPPVQVDLVMTSPLTRCLQTSVLAFGIPGDCYCDNDNNNNNLARTTNNPRKTQEHEEKDEDNSHPVEHVIPSQQQQQATRITKVQTLNSSSHGSTSSTIPPILCVELLREACGIHYPDKRRPTEVLKSHWGHWIQFDTDYMMSNEDELWSEYSRESCRDVEERISQFLQLLCQLSETCIVVISHGVWMETLFQRYDPQALMVVGEKNHSSTAGTTSTVTGGGPPLSSPTMTYRRVYNCDAFATQCVSSCRRRHHHHSKNNDATTTATRSTSTVFLRLQNTTLI